MSQVLHKSNFLTHGRVRNDVLLESLVSRVISLSGEVNDVNSSSCGDPYDGTGPVTRAQAAFRVERVCASSVVSVLSAKWGQSSLDKAVSDP